MSKFTRPEIEVVRFNEADVLVASGKVGDIITVSGFNDTIARNGKVTYRGGSFSNTQTDNYLALLQFFGISDASSFYLHQSENDSSPTNLNAMILNDNPGNSGNDTNATASYGNLDGNYEFDGKHFVKQ